MDSQKIKKIAKIWRDKLSVSSEKDWGKINNAFFSFLRERSLIRFFPRISRELRILSFSDRSEKVSVVVKSPYPIDPDLLKGFIKNRFGLSGFNIKNVIDEDIIAGIKIESNEKMLDLSVNRQLQLLKEKIKKV